MSLPDGSPFLNLPVEWRLDRQAAVCGWADRYPPIDRWTRFECDGYRDVEGKENFMEPVNPRELPGVSPADGQPFVEMRGTALAIGTEDKLLIVDAHRCLHLVPAERVRVLEKS